MSRLPTGLRLLTKLLLALHPPGVRRGWRDRYEEAVEHRWRLERDRRERGAGVRTAWILVADGLSSIPREWIGLASRVRESGRTDRGRRPGGTVRHSLGLWMQEVRIVARTLIRRPGFSALVVATLALGIGTNASIFGVLDQVILNPFPWSGDARFFYIMERDVERGFIFSPSQDEYERWKEGARTLHDLEVFQVRGVVRSDHGGAERVGLTFVSVGLGSMIGLRAVEGRGFGPGDAAPGAPPVVMVEEGYWRRSFGGDPGVIGETVTLDGETRTVVGVWPAEGRVQLDGDTDFYAPFERGEEVSRSSFSILLARLDEGTTPEAAERELTALRPPPAEGQAGAAPVPTVLPPYYFVGDDFVSGLWVLFWGVAALLVIAALNASNLLLDRTVAREGELGVRIALGGSTARLLGHFMLESAILVGVGTAVGVVSSKLAGRALANVAPSDIPAVAFSDFGSAAPLYTVGVLAGVTLLCGLLPLLHVRSTGIRHLLPGRDGRRGGRSLLRSALVAFQVGLATVLLVGSGLTFSSLLRILAVDPGFAVEEILMITVRGPESADVGEGNREAVYGRVAPMLENLPGVESVSASSVIPLRYSVRFGSPFLDGEQRPDAPGSYARSVAIGPGFLETMGIPLLEGRDFRPDERETSGEARVVIVNRSFAKRYPESILGRELRFPSDPADARGYRIVGVVGDVRAATLTEERGRPQVYYPSRGLDGGSEQRFLIRADDPGALPPLIRVRLARTEPSVRMTAAETGRQMIRKSTEDERFLAVLLGVFSVLSLALAVGGVYGAVSLHVQRRTREMGIRRALGARWGEVMTLVVLHGLRPVVVGVALGAGGAALLVGQLRGLLYDTSVGDPLVFTGAITLLLGAAAVASAAPARRVGRSAPLQSLREE